MRIEEIEQMISYQKRTIQNAARISKEFKSGYMAALNTLAASIDAKKEEGEEEIYIAI
jgi:hypothetical protein